MRVDKNQQRAKFNRPFAWNKQAKLSLLSRERRCSQLIYLKPKGIIPKKITQEVR